MSEMQREQERDDGPGGGERSEPEPGPSSRGRRGPRPVQALRRYTPQERRAAVEALAKSGLTYGGFARVWGVSRHTVYIWVKRYRELGPKGLEHPTGEGRPGRKPLAAPLREEIVLVQRRFPDFGLRRVRDWLARFRGVKVSAAGVRSAIEAAGVPRAVIPRRPWRRPGGTMRPHVNASSRPSAVASRRPCRAFDRTVHGERRGVKRCFNRSRNWDSSNGPEVAGDRPRQTGIQLPHTTTRLDNEQRSTSLGSATCWSCESVPGDLFVRY